MMPSMRKLVIVMVLALPALGFLRPANAPKKILSEYGFFRGDLRLQQPADGVLPYHLNTPLFSDYAEKLRFVKLPPGASVRYNDTSVFDFPVGTALIKTFYFPVDARDPVKGRRLMETRVLLHEEAGWKALPYIWNDAQTDAELDVAGATLQVNYTDEQGRKKDQVYIIPNLNQCKGCHNRNEELMPIGPSAWQLNGDHDYGTVRENQLKHWQDAGMLRSVHSPMPKGIVWNDPSTGTVEERARIWLDINCAHCHRPEGPASTSGLHLGWREKDPSRLGVHKTPVAAGRGSGELRFGIVPGKPDESILLYRLRSVDPGIMMPELGRTQAQPEAVALVREWIRGME
jgi:uncharacterized repeat protein (TIGR03806 family)